MTEVLLVCGMDGGFKRCHASGHAGFSVPGSDIVCAAETMLLRTAMEVLQNTSGIQFFADTSTRGTLAFRVEKNGSSQLERLKCTADFIRTGISSLSDEYPQNVHLREMTEV